ncbi:MAG: F0F1 ATP synthase subunit A [Kiritimatiellaeota bacterium]|nr:F0F1 ATP synthase subunit A [Kiritimatiellota bacterium]
MAESLTTQATDLAAAKMAAVNEFIMRHVANSHEWAPFGKAIELPSFLSVHGLMLVIGATILVALFGLLYRHKDPVPHGLTNLLEMFVLLVRNQIAIPFLGEKDGRRMAPLFCSFFFFILCLNLMSITPRRTST